MTREEFDALVRQVENGIGRNAVALRRRVALWAFVGYGVFLGGLAFVLLLAAAFIVPGILIGWEGWFLLLLGALVLLGGGAAAVRALWIRLPPPEGVLITRPRAPRLFAMLDELRAQLRSMPFHTVLVVANYNAGVVQSPRLGVLGWWRNYLLLGLPLMESLSEAEFRAVLAHEFAHLSKEHGRFGHWLYRLRRAWEQVFEKLRRPRAQNEITLRPLIAKLVEWFWPRFNAHAFVFSRVNEYEADAIAAQLAGAAHIASALVRIRLFARWTDEKFWPDTWQRANTEPLPPPDVFLRLRDAMRGGLDADESPKRLQEAMREVTTNADTHPCLTERLQALNALPVGAAVPGPAPQSAAGLLLGDALESIRSELQQHWAEKAAATWRERHARAGALQHRLTRIGDAAALASDVDVLWDKAHVVLELKNDAAAEPLLRQILTLRPDHVAANFCLGRRLLELGDNAGETHLERAIAADEQILPRAGELLYAHFRASGRNDRLRDLNARLDQYERDFAESQKERSAVTAADTFVVHDLTAAELRSLQEVMATQPTLGRAHLGRKQLRHFPKQRLFLLCVETKRAWHRLPNRSADETLAKQLSRLVQLPGRVLVFPPHGSFSGIAHKLRRVDGTEIFRG